MAGITAAAILKDLDRRTQAREMEALAQLDQTHAEAVRQALGSLKPRATIDVRLLVSDVRARVAAAKVGDGSNAWRYGITLLSDAELKRLRDQLRGGRVAGGRGDELYRRAGIPVHMPAYAYVGDAEPDEEPDEDFDGEPKRRRPIKRLRSRRLVSTKRKSKPKPEPFILGGRAFDEHGALGPDPSYRPLRPPWLLSDGDDDPDEDDSETETDKEGESRCLQHL